MKVVQKQELLGREPDAKEAGYLSYENWPEGVNYERYLAAIRQARAGMAVEPSASTRPADVSSTSPRAAEQPKQNPRDVPVPATTVAVAQPVAVVAGWYPDSAQPTILRWWDGSNWTHLTAPGPGALPGWFSDPDHQDRLRWWDGTRWTEHTAASPNAATAPAISATEERPQLPGPLRRYRRGK